jgi:hypothetical protein
VFGVDAKGKDWFKRLDGHDLNDLNEKIREVERQRGGTCQRTQVEFANSGANSTPEQM